MRELTGNDPESPGFSDAGGTLYAQVAAVLRQRIRSGAWRPGAQLPTLESLSAEFGVARVTLRQALGLLEREGLIWRRRGRGTFVTEDASVQWLHVGSSWEELVHSLEGNWARPIDSEDVAQVPGFEERDGLPAPNYRHLRRVHGREARAHALVDLYLDRRLYDMTPKRFDKEMLIPVLEELPSVRIADARQTLSIGTADHAVAAALDIPIGAPVGLMRRVLKDDVGTVIYVGDVAYRGDVVKIEIDLERGRQQVKSTADVRQGGGAKS